MKIEDAKKISQLYKERLQLVELLDISKNYDFTMYAEFYSVHNNNRGSTIHRDIKLPKEIYEEILTFIRKKIDNIDKELERY